MRIVGGRLRGRALAAPTQGDQSIRPTTDRARESLFNIISHHWPDKLDGSRAIDLFAGTGANGLEAMSRGASFCLFVEAAVGARGLIRKNIEAMQLQGVTQLFRRDATRLGPIGTMKPFELAFLDPPYGRGLAERALASLHDGGWLNDDALLVVEEATDHDFACPSTYSVIDEREMGRTVLRFLQPVSENR